MRRRACRRPRLGPNPRRLPSSGGGRRASAHMGNRPNATGRSSDSQGRAARRDLGLQRLRGTQVHGDGSVEHRRRAMGWGCRGFVERLTGDSPSDRVTSRLREGDLVVSHRRPDGQGAIACVQGTGATDGRLRARRWSAVPRCTGDQRTRGRAVQRRTDRPRRGSRQAVRRLHPGRSRAIGCRGCPRRHALRAHVVTLQAGPSLTVDVTNGAYEWLMFGATALAAIATAAAAIVALVLANRERRDRVEAESELRVERALMRRAQASRVSVRMEPLPATVDALTRNESLARDTMGYTLTLTNDSDGPIRRAQPSTYLRFVPHDVEREVHGYYFGDLVRPGETATIQIVWLGPPVSQVVDTQFSDAHGVRWRIDDEGTLVDLEWEAALRAARAPDPGPRRRSARA